MSINLIRLIGRVIIITNYRIYNKNATGCCINIFSLKNGGFVDYLKHTKKK